MKSKQTKPLSPQRPFHLRYWAPDGFRCPDCGAVLEWSWPEPLPWEWWELHEECKR